MSNLSDISHVEMQFFVDGSPVGEMQKIYTTKENHKNIYEIGGVNPLAYFSSHSYETNEEAVCLMVEE